MGAVLKMRGRQNHDAGGMLFAEDDGHGSAQQTWIKIKQQDCCRIMLMFSLIVR